MPGVLETVEQDRGRPAGQADERGEARGAQRRSALLGPQPTQRFRDLLPGIRYDFAVVGAMDGRLGESADLAKPVLLMSGTKSPTFLRDRVRELAGPLQHAEHIELTGLGHSGPCNTSPGGRPNLVAQAPSSRFA